MKFFKVLPKENLKSACKRYLRAYNFIKKKHRCFPVNIPEFLEQLFFYRSTAVAALELCFSIRNNFYQRKLWRDLTSLFNVQRQVSTSRSTTTRAFVLLAKSTEFFYHKIFETTSR